MNTIPDNDHLSEEDLKRILEGKSDARVDQLLAECEFSREAVEGYRLVPGAITELPAIKQKISSSGGLSSMPVWKQNLIASCVAVIIIGIPAYFLWPKSAEDDTKDGLTRPIAQQLDPEHGPASVPPVLTPQGEHFINPDAKPIQPKAPKIVLDSAKGIPVPITEADPIESNPPEMLTQEPVVPEHPEEGYNASIGFLFDIKITEFEKYNSITIRQKEIVLPGVPAEFDDASARDHSGNDRETVREVPAEKILKEALLAFRDQRYGRCIEKMELLLKKDPKDQNALFYTGVCYVKLEMHAKALPYFQQVLESKNNVFHEEAKWYEALALIGAGNTADAKVLLKEISESDGFYKDKAKDKLKSME